MEFFNDFDVDKDEHLSYVFISALTASESHQQNIK